MVRYASANAAYLAKKKVIWNPLSLTRFETGAKIVSGSHFLR